MLLPFTRVRAPIVPCALALVAWFAGNDSLAAVQDDPVVATVNGEEIRRSALEDLRQVLPEQYQSMPLEFVFPFLLDQAIDGRLVTIEGRKANLQDDEEVKARLAAVEDRIIQQVYVARHLERAVTDEAVRERYDAGMAAFPPTEEVLARHILVETEPAAQAIIIEIRGGADFETVAQERSIAPSAPDGGDIGYITRDSVVPEFAEAALALEPGQMTTRPVQTQYGWHVIKIEDKRMLSPPTLDEVRDQISQELMRDAIASLFEELRAGAEIERFNMDGTPVEDAPPEEQPEEGAPETE